MLFTSEGIINIRNEKWKKDFSAIDPLLITFADQQYTKAYLRHLFIAGEYLAGMIASVHNLGFYLWLAKESRRRIIDGTFSAWKDEMVIKLSRRL
jgi:queuine tRNA-ribosyltransferase